MLFCLILKLVIITSFISYNLIPHFLARYFSTEVLSSGFNALSNNINSPIKILVRLVIDH